MEDDFDISLITCMAYNENFICNLKEMFDSLQVDYIPNPPMIRKGKEIDVKHINVKAGTIISAKFGNLIKGLDRVPSGKYKFYTDDGEFIDTYDNIAKYGRVNLMEKIDQVIMCEQCEEFIAQYAPAKSKKPLFCKSCVDEMGEEMVIIPDKKAFPHQITINYCYKDGMNINMFIFRKNIKISGFQYEKYAIRMVKKFWKLHMIKNPEAITYFAHPPAFIFESSMTNSSFETDYNFMLTKVNTLIQSLKQTNDSIIATDFEPTIDTGIKIKLKAIKPGDYTFNKITYENDSWTDSLVSDIVGRNKTNDLDNKKTTVYLYDERYMISTRYGVVLKPACKFLNKILVKHRDQLEIIKDEKIVKYKPNYI